MLLLASQRVTQILLSHEKGHRGSPLAWGGWQEDPKTKKGAQGVSPNISWKEPQKFMDQIWCYNRLFQFWKYRMSCCVSVVFR